MWSNDTLSDEDKWGYGCTVPEETNQGSIQEFSGLAQGDETLQEVLVHTVQTYIQCELYKVCPSIHT